MLVTTCVHNFSHRRAGVRGIPVLSHDDRLEIVNLITSMLDARRPRFLINGAVKELVEEALCKTVNTWAIVDNLVRGFNVANERDAEAPCLTEADRARIRLEVCGMKGAGKSFPETIVHLMPLISAACVYAAEITSVGRAAVAAGMRPYYERIDDV